MPSPRLQKLEDQLAAASGEAAEIDALNALAAEVLSENVERAIQLARQALHLSRQGSPDRQPYPGQAAASLAILGNVANLRCEYNAALTYFQEAQTLLENIPDHLTWGRILRGLGWVYFNLGDFPLAIEMLQKAIKSCRENADRESEAAALNSLGAVYGESGEKEASIEALKRALYYLAGTDNYRLIAIVHNNLAMTQLETADYPAAIENAAESYRIACQLGTAELLASSLDTIGQIYLVQKKFIQAEDYFKQAIAIYQGEGSDPDEFTLNLAQAAIGQGQLDRAAALLTDSIAAVEKLGKNRFAYRFHELLARVYEEQGQFQNSIKHYKRFHALKSRYFNEETQRRLSNLLVVQQAETSRIDAEIYRLKNLALRQEVAVHQQAVAEMEVLATTDTLTGLLNRRHFMTLANYSFESARKSGRSLSVMMMDLDDFKKVNDCYGHLAGDRVLAEISALIQSSLRSEDLLGRYGGEEFSAVFPNTELAEVEKLAARILKNISGHITWAGRQAIQITISIGAAAIAPDDPGLTSLLERADRALYTAKRDGKNTIRSDSPDDAPEKKHLHPHCSPEDEWKQIG